MIIRNQDMVGLAPAKVRRKASLKIKPSTIAIYASVFALVVAMISIGYNQPQSASMVANTVNVTSVTSSDQQPSVDDVIAAGVAAGVAQVNNLPIATSVANLAVSIQTEGIIVQSDGINTSKPQIIGSSAVERLVTSYTIQAGDTVETLAAKLNISEDTVKWANNLTSNLLTEGETLQILPVNGVLYTVKAGDTVDSIATKYKVDKTRLLLSNDLEVSGISEGSKIILPEGILPTEERPGYVAPVTYVYQYAGLGTGFGGNTWYISSGTPDGPYAHGNCTLYSYNRRIQLGLPVGTNWGNAVSWAANARQNGLVVDNTPSVGAIMQNGGYLGHVAIVESIEENGDIKISEMNAYVSGGGYNVVSGRLVHAGNASQYLFIH